VCWQFRLVMSLYAATYMVANSADSVFERRGELHTPQHSTGKLLVTSATNLALSATKDRSFGLLFGVSAATGFPLMSTGLFFLRDMLTLACAFTLPRSLEPLVDRCGVHKTVSNALAQIVLPVSAQLVGTLLDGRHKIRLMRVGRAAPKAGGSAQSCLSSAGLSVSHVLHAHHIFHPCILQVSTPLHLLSYDMYNNKLHSLAQRCNFIRSK